ncbi:MAG: phosphatase PAP2 family protein [Saprospiraceae bacterium]|nr:phosphatase PAP2 family protein [Saprospiraceae bacterium]
MQKYTDCMAKTIRENGFYFYLRAAFIVVGGLYLGISDKTDALYFFSANRSPWLDSAFRFITKLGEGPIYFVLGIVALAVRLRYTLAISMTGLTVMAFSFGLKSLFAIDRPAAYFAKQNLTEQLNFVAGVDVHTGATSFPSGHAMSAFALYSLLAFFLPSAKRYALPLFALAFLICISRLYLVQHFWPDVYFGGLVGVGLAMLWFALLGRKEASWLDRPILPLHMTCKHMNP